MSETAHEIEEAITDPDVSAYYTLGTDSQGNSYKWENEDRCVYQYGATYTVTSQTTGAVGATANIRLQNTDYMIQENWVNVESGYCDTVFEPTTGVFWGQDIWRSMVTRGRLG
jgi:hypothetical protein